MIDDYSDIISEVTSEINHESFINDIEMVKVSDIGADLEADTWITWVDEKPRKNPEAVYQHPQLWDPDFDPVGSMFHDDHSYADKDAGKNIYDSKENTFRFS